MNSGGKFRRVLPTERNCEDMCAKDKKCTHFSFCAPGSTCRSFSSHKCTGGYAHACLVGHVCKLFEKCLKVSEGFSRTGKSYKGFKTYPDVEKQMARLLPTPQPTMEDKFVGHDEEDDRWHNGTAMKWYYDHGVRGCSIQMQSMLSSRGGPGCSNALYPACKGLRSHMSLFSMFEEDPLDTRSRLLGTAAFRPGRGRNPGVCGECYELKVFPSCDDEANKKSTSAKMECDKEHNMDV